jgi:SAM-dependent methyltransferase
LNKNEYISPASSERLPFKDNSFDFVYSIAAFEHIDKPSETVSEIRRVLINGELTVHEIDLTHHRSKGPLLFLNWPEEVYKRRTEKDGGCREIDGIIHQTWKGEVYCNRLRRSDYDNIFSEYGFKLFKVEPVAKIDPSKIDILKMDETFRSKGIDDLSVAIVRAIARNQKD